MFPVNDLAFGHGDVPNNYLLAAQGYLPLRRNFPITDPEGSIGLWNVDTGSELERYTTSVSNEAFNAVRSVDWDPFESEPYKFVASTSIGDSNNPSARAIIFNTTGAPIADLVLANASLLRSACTSAMYHPSLPLIVAAEGSGGTTDQITLWDAVSSGIVNTPLSKVTHTYEDGSSSDPVWTARFIDEGQYRDHMVVTSRKENSPFTGSVSLWNISDPTNPTAATGSPMNLEGGVNAFCEPATILFEQLFGNVNLMVTGNDTSAGYLGNTALIDTLPLGRKFTSKLTIQTPVQTYSAKPIATCILKNPGCTTGDRIGLIYVGFTDGTIGYQSSCDLVTADKPFTFISGHPQGYTIGWAEAYGIGSTGYLVTVAGKPDGTGGVAGETRIWKLDNDGTPSLEITITRLSSFAQVAKFQPETNTLAIGYRDGIIEIWKLQ